MFGQSCVDLYSMTGDTWITFVFFVELIVLSYFNGLIIDYNY